MTTKCPECKKEVNYKDSYRCRICHDYFCSDCSLKHFALLDNGEEVRHKSLLGSFWWIFKKRFSKRR